VLGADDLILLLTHH
jgi:hypothetical protein